MVDVVFTLSIISNFSEYLNNTDLLISDFDSGRFSFLNFNLNREEKITLHYYYGVSDIQYKVFPLRDGMKIFNEPTFDKRLKTVVYLHGYSENPAEYITDQSVFYIVRAFLSNDERKVNLIVVNYSDLVSRFRPFSIQLEYIRAAYNVPFIGTQIGNILSSYISICGGCMMQIHLIGFSLGAQVAHFVSKRLLSDGYKVGRITGLEPARPLFYSNALLEHLSKDDAYFVDVVHTDQGELGWPTHLGHADFWPNKGISLQPYCMKHEPTAACSHMSSSWYYAASILRPELFPAQKCESATKWTNGECNNNDIVTFGYHLQPTEGDYFFSTLPDYPFGKGYEGLQSTFYLYYFLFY